MEEEGRGGESEEGRGGKEGKGGDEERGEEARTGERTGERNFRCQKGEDRGKGRDKRVEEARKGIKSLVHVCVLAHGCLRLLHVISPICVRVFLSDFFRFSFVIASQSRTKGRALHRAPQERKDSISGGGGGKEEEEEQSCCRRQLGRLPLSPLLRRLHSPPSSFLETSRPFGFASKARFLQKNSICSYAILPIKITCCTK